MKIYTRGGDSGQTDLFGGARVSKAHARVSAYGAVDAANSAIGFIAASASVPPAIRAHLPSIMSDLFDIGAELATAPAASAQEILKRQLDSSVDAARVSELENWIDSAEDQLPVLRVFVLPTGCESAARCHLARVSVRLAEQKAIELLETGEVVPAPVLAYLNRLSDLLFVWARLCNRLEGIADVHWKAKKDRANGMS